jgi:hypothetical protein
MKKIISLLVLWLIAYITTIVMIKDTGTIIKNKPGVFNLYDRFSYNY